MEDNHANDAWGRPLKMFCGADLPAGAKGIVSDTHLESRDLVGIWRSRITFIR